MEVILIKEVSNLGNPGEIVKVKPGYASNYLFPQKLAVKKSATSLKILEKQKSEFSKEIEAKQKSYQEQIDQINQIGEMEIPVKASKEGKLFGAVTTMLIQQHLKDDHQLDIDRKQILIKSPIKTVDHHEIEIILNKQFKTMLKIKLKTIS